MESNKCILIRHYDATDWKDGINQRKDTCIWNVAPVYIIFRISIHSPNCHLIIPNPIFHRAVSLLETQIQPAR